MVLLATLWSAMVNGAVPIQPLLAQGQPTTPATSRLTRVTVDVPRRRSADAYWDQALGGLLLGNTRELLPDVKICWAASGGPATCLPTCKDAPNCSQVIDIVASGPVRLTVFDADATNRDELIFDATIPDPAACDPCRVEATGGIAEVRFAASPVVRAAEPAQPGCPMALRDRYLACQGGADVRDSAVCATAVDQQRAAAATVRDWADRHQLETMHPASRLQLLEALVAAPPTPDAIDARNRIYASKPPLNRDLDFWAGFTDRLAPIAEALDPPGRGAWAVMTRDHRRTAVTRLIEQILSGLDASVNAIRWQQSLNQLAVVQPVGHYDPRADEIVLSDGLLIRVQRDPFFGGAIEETVHAWQAEVAARYVEDEISEDGPLCQQARFFFANLISYQDGLTSTLNRAYRGQPLEAFAKDAAHLLYRDALQ